MPQHFCDAPVQSVSEWQTFTAFWAGPQMVVLLTSDLRMHAWPIEVSQAVSPEQNLGHNFASWQTLPAVP
jgi:hypothetical protein